MSEFLTHKSGHSEIHILIFISIRTLLLLDGIKTHFIMIVDHGEQTEPTVIEFLPSVLSSRIAWKGHCDITGRVPKYQEYCEGQPKKYDDLSWPIIVVHDRIFDAEKNHDRRNRNYRASGLSRNETTIYRD